MIVRDGWFRASRWLVLAVVVALPMATAAARALAPIDALAGVPAHGPGAADARLKAQREGNSVSMEPRLGVPTFLWAARAGVALKAAERTPSAKAGLDETGMARAYLRDLADLYRITANEVDALPRYDLQRLPGGSALVRFRNRIDGVDVFREQVSVLLDGEGSLVAVGGFVMGAPSGGPKNARAFTLSPEQAVATALADFAFSPAIAKSLRQAGNANGYVQVELPAGAASDDGSALAQPARVKRVWFRLGSELVGAHYVEVQVRDGSPPHGLDYYAYVVAVDGTVLFRHNQTSDVAFSYRVYAESAGPNLPLPGPAGRNGFPHPTATPDGYQPPFVPPNLVTLQNAPFSKNDPWLPPTATRTIGNNVEAYSDARTPDGFNPADPNECDLAIPIAGDSHACTNAPNTFDYTYDPAQPPNVNRTQLMAAVTNLFYMNNYLHDFFYDAGFDEAAGNAQVDNYGRGGLANDSLLAEAEDFSGTDNATMSTPADGARPRMHMFVWNRSIALAKVNAPASIAGVKQAGTAVFGAQSFDFTNDLVLALDAANSEGPTTTDGCSPFANAAAVAGRIAAIDRGVCTFVVKVRNAQTAGAVGVLILNNVAGAINMAGSDPVISIPAVSVSSADGDAIKALLAAPETVNVRIARKAGVQRDGALDNTLVAHEWGHYISNRLIGDANGLTANQARGMGEGFADFHALLLLVKDGDRLLASNANFNGTYPETPYTLAGPDFAPDVLNNAYYHGIRRYPYSRDPDKNPLTFKHVSDGVPLPATPVRSPVGSSANSEVHNTGEVWASMLWECYANLLNDRTRLTFAEAQDRMKRYLVGGYKMTPADPTFVSARDALLAVMLAQDAQDHALCYQGFARRGAGQGAVAPERYSEDNAGVVESFRSVPLVFAPGGGAKRLAIEYYHAAFDHYFVTDIPDEIAKLDSGFFEGWARTGESFNGYTNAPAGSAGVCRFFSTSFGLKSSHFYTPDLGECAIVKANPNWQFEGTVFAVLTPGTDGGCPTGSQPLYRLYNNGQGAAPNHRYTTSTATRSQMLAKGWIPEGHGALGVAMCAPP